jgi:hypothetical protein
MLLIPLFQAPQAQAAPEQCFPETGQCLGGRFQEFWQGNGSLPVFGFPITAANDEWNRDTGQSYATQWLERNRFELHSKNTAPYDVLLGRLGDDRLRQQGIDWRTLPRASGAKTGCLWFSETRHNVCDQGTSVGFKTYWQTHGLQDARLTPYQRSLALFGLPLSEPRMETNASGDRVLTQWFERARFEWHPTKPTVYKVLLGLLGRELKPSASRPPRAELEQYAREVATLPVSNPAACGLPSVPAPADLGKTVRVFFACGSTKGPTLAAIPARTVPVPPDADPKATALRALLAGPTPAERRAGYLATFGPTTQATPFTIEVLDGGLAVVDFDPAILNVIVVSPDRRTHVFVANEDAYQVFVTLGQFPDVKRVTILVGGRPLCKVQEAC